MDYDALIKTEEDKLKTAAAEFQAFTQQVLKTQEIAQTKISRLEGGILLLRELKKQNQLEVESSPS